MTHDEVAISFLHGGFMLVPQMIGGMPFSKILEHELANSRSADVAVAWVRASGVGLIWEKLVAFLDNGGLLRIVVGIDRENTSIEGLDLLLSLKGNVSVWVRHNEAMSLFHPKLFAFETPTCWRIYVGSNNLTGGGLSSNEEISVLTVADRGGPVETALGNYFSSLTDDSDDLVKKLTKPLLKKLIREKYVLSEAVLFENSRSANAASVKRVALFGSKHPKRLRNKNVPKNSKELRPTENINVWKRIFVKILLARGTQGQIPVSVARAIRHSLGLTPIDGPIPIILDNNPAERAITPTYATRNPDHANTYKLEAMAPRDQSVLKIEVINGVVFVEQYDTADPAGRVILDMLIKGLHEQPRSTVSSRKVTGTSKKMIRSQAKNLTLYRFD